jgi:hypothetical protein
MGITGGGGLEMEGQLWEEGARGLIANHRDLKIERGSEEGGQARPESRSVPA